MLTRSGLAVVLTACTGFTPSALGSGGGDDASTATVISTLPYADTGDTGVLTDQFDVVCPFSGSTSPDAWYHYDAAEGEELTVRSCDSAYDTKVYILDDAFRVVACNDDSCGGSFRAELATPALTAGTHFIVVDGWGGDSGVYQLDVTETVPCVIECPPDSANEGEPCDDSGGTDTNGGCNSAVFIIDHVTCGQTICGASWALGGTRDTDWYELAPTGLGGDLDLVTLTVTAGFDAVVFYLGEFPDCGATAILDAGFTVGCGDTASAGGPIGSDIASIWIVAKVDFDGLPCNVRGLQSNDYVAQWSCEDIAPGDPCPALGDTNGDGLVDFNDLLALLANFGPCP